MTIPYLVRKKADLSSGKKGTMVRRSEEIAGTRRSGFNETGGTAVQAQPFSTGDDYGYPVGIGRYD